MKSKFLTLGAILFSLTAAVRPGDWLREQKAVTIAGVAETWQLVWEGKPKPICAPDETEMAMTCPCMGYAYGELGKLSLVRQRGGKEVERMELGPLFGELPADNSAGLAAMQWRPMKDSDWQGEGRSGAAFLAEVRRRPGARVMNLADYDHDGVASEFLIQVDTLPCGKLQYAAVGVSKANPRLHALSSAANPGQPLVMPAHVWAALAKSTRPRWLTVWPCGDHGADTVTEVLAEASAGRITARQRITGCEGEQNGKLLGDEAI